MPQVTFLPIGITVECKENEPIFDAGRRGNIPIPTACVGKGSCGLCRVKIVSGEQFLPALNREEAKHLGNTYFITKLRLSCQARVSGGDVTVLIPDMPVKPPDVKGK